MSFLDVGHFSWIEISGKFAHPEHKCGAGLIKKAANAIIASSAKLCWSGCSKGLRGRVSKGLGPLRSLEQL